MAERDTTPDTDFERDAVALAKALDEFAEELSTVLEHYGAGRKALVQAMGVDQSDLSGWMQGHEQIHQIKSRRLPGTAEVDALINHTGLQEKNPSQARRLREITRQVEDLAARLSERYPRSWGSQAARCLEAQQYSSPAAKKGQEEPANSGGSESSSPAKNAAAVPRRLLVHSLFAAIGAVCSIAAVVYFLSSKDSSTSSSPSVAALSSPSALPSATAEPSPSASVSPSASPEPSSSADLPATVEETEEPREPREQLSVATKNCRSWASMINDTVQVRPCIKKENGQIAVSAEVKAFSAEIAGTDVTVWVWLMDLDPDLIDSQQYHLTRDPSTLNSCRVTLDTHQARECGPFFVEPAEPGRYTTATTVKKDDEVYPPGWSSPSFSGTLSPGVDWP